MKWKDTVRQLKHQSWSWKMISFMNVVKQILQSVCWNVTLSPRLISALHAVGCCTHRDQQGAASSHWAVVFLHWHLLSVESRHRAAGWHTVSCSSDRWRGKKKHKARPGPVRLQTDWFELDGSVENKMKEKRWMRRPVGEVTAREGVMEGVWMEGWRTMGGCRVS